MRVNVEFDIEGLDDIDIRQIIEDESLISPGVNCAFQRLVVKNTVRELVYAGGAISRFRVSGFKLIDYWGTAK